MVSEWLTRRSFIASWDLLETLVQTKSSIPIHEFLKSHARRIEWFDEDAIYDFPGLDTEWSRHNFDFPPTTTVAVTTRARWKLLETTIWFFKNRGEDSETRIFR